MKHQVTAVLIANDYAVRTGDSNVDEDDELEQIAGDCPCSVVSIRGAGDVGEAGEATEASVRMYVIQKIPRSHKSHGRALFNHPFSPWTRLGNSHLVRTRRFTPSLDECPCSPRVLRLLFPHPPSYVCISCFNDTCVLCSQRRPAPVWPLSTKFVSASLRLSFIRPKLLSPCCPLGTQRSRQSEPPHCGRRRENRLEDGEHTRTSVRLPIHYLNDYVATAFLSVVSLRSLPMRFQSRVPSREISTRVYMIHLTRMSPHRMNISFPCVLSTESSLHLTILFSCISYSQVRRPRIPPGSIRVRNHRGMRTAGTSRAFRFAHKLYLSCTCAQIVIRKMHRKISAPSRSRRGIHN
jgi:hypothetical protein